MPRAQGNSLASVEFDKMNLVERLEYYKSILMMDMLKDAKAHYQNFQAFKDIVEPFVGEIKGKRILEIGCGRWYHYTVLLSNLGNTVTGIDIAHIGINEPLFKKYLGILNEDGFLFLGKEVAFDVLLKKRTFFKTWRRWINII